MHHQLPRPLPLTASLAVAAALLVAAPGSAAPARAGTAGPGASQSITLLNGERVSITWSPGREQPVVIAPTARRARPSSLLSVSLGGRSYLIPAAGLPYLGRGLDLSLFQLSALQRVEAHGRLPVKVSFHGHRPALPGVHITSSRPATATGYLTASSARLFGAALARQAGQAAADHALARSGRDGLFPDGASIALAGAAPSRAARPGVPLHTLTVTGSDLAGRPDTGATVFVANVDNSNRFTGQNHFERGTATFSVPAGHYWAIAIFMTASTQGFTSQRLVIDPQFTVSGQHTAVHLAERTASSQISMVTPRPAEAENSSFEIRRPGRAGPVQYWAFLDSGFPVWVSPSRARPTVGALRTFTDQQLVSPPGTPGTPYEYDLASQGPSGIIPGQRNRVQAADLATVQARYDQDVPSTGDEVRYGLFPGQLGDLLFEADNFFPQPRQQTEYLTGDPAVRWFGSVLQFYPSAPAPGGQSDAVRSFRAGARTNENWDAYPLHPGPNVNLLGAANPAATLPSASRAGNLLSLDLTPFSDNQPGHLGTGFSAARYQVDQDGLRLAVGSVINGPADVRLRTRLSSRPAVIRFALSASRSGAAYPLSARTATVWTWRSAPGPQRALPPGWRCPGDGSALRGCAVQPMMTLRYAVSGLALDGSAPAGPQGVAITAGHLQLARPARVASLAAWVSVDNGQKWQAVSVVRRTGTQFAATFMASPGAFVTLRVRAADTLGGSITETIHRAYQIAAGSLTSLRLRGPGR